MAGKVPNLNPDAYPVRIKGVAHVYWSEKWQRFIARSWPKSDGKETPSRALGRATFKQVVKAIKSVCVEDRMAVQELSANTPYLDRDLLMKAAMGTLVQFQDSNGRFWMSTRVAIQGVQAMLDSISAKPGSMLFRAPNYWASIDAPVGDGVMLWSDAEGVAWWAPYEEAIQTILEGFGAGEGAVLYRNATEWTFLPAGAVGNVLTAGGIGADVAWLPAGGTGGTVQIGIGVPTALEAPGQLYSRSDAAEVWSSQPITTGGSVAQHVITIFPPVVPGSVTLPGAPTPGNLLIAYCGFGNAGGTAPTYNLADWTLIGENLISSSPKRVSGFALARIVQVGDTAVTPPLATAGGDYAGITCVEINGTASSTVADIVTTSFNDSVTKPCIVGPITTLHSGELVLAFGTQYNGGAVMVMTGSGWTLDGNAQNAALYGAMGLWHRSESSAGSVVSDTISGGGGSLDIESTFMCSINVSTTTTPNWVKVSV